MLCRWIVFLLVLAGIAFSAGIHQITEGPASDDFPVFSPDGIKIAFQRGVWNGFSPDQYDIYIKYLSSSAIIRITYDPADDLLPAWSSNGNNILFLSGRTPTGAWCHNLITNEETLLAEGASSICWSPNGQYIAYSKVINGDVEIFKKNLQTGIDTQLTFEPGQDGYPDWSPDGQNIIYNHGDYNPGIYIIPANGGIPTQVPGIWGWGPKYSPDGTKICFDAGSLTAGVFIYIYDLTTTQLTNTHVLGMDSDWSPLGDKIAYMYSGDIYYMDYPFVQESSSLGKIKALYK